MSKFKSSGRLATALRKYPARPAPLPAKPSQGSNVAGVSHAAEPGDPADEVFQSQVSNPTRQLAFKITLFFLFLRFSYLHEYLASKLHFDTHLLVVVSAVSYFAAFLAGGFLDAFRERATWMWFGFATCMTLATATSTWRGGSFAMLVPYLRTTLPFVLLIPAVALTRDDLRKVLSTIGVAGSATILLGLLSSDFKSGRMELGSAGSSIQDSNDYAAHMILLLPAIAYLFFGPKRGLLFKALGVVFLSLGLYQIFSTGSRGGLVGLIVTLLYIVKRGTPRIRLLILVVVPALALAVLAFVPQESSQRLRSLFNSEDATEEAVESREARQALFWASVSITLHHPLLGVGPDEFMDYQAGVAGQHGQRGMWHVTHNGYTQISSECGIPALVFFLVAIGMTYRSLRRATKSGVPIVSTVANLLSIMMVGYCVCIIFLSQGYNFNLPIVTAITTAINRLMPQNNLEEEAKTASQIPAAARLA